MAAVLLIEDDAAQRMIASFALKKAGHEVREAADGEEGLAAARADPPEVVVCDVMLPGIDGYEVVAAVRADPALANLPLILLTAMSDRQHVRQGMTAGADDYLTKPYRPHELCEAVVAVLARRQAQQQAVIDSLSGMVESALEEQKETLGRQYERRLHREINARWARSTAPGGDARYEHAFVLLAELLGGGAAEDAAQLAARLKQAQQSALDTFYLFGANHVLPYGSRVIAVFGAGDADSTPLELRALRAAVALAKAQHDRALSIGLHAGAIVLVAVNDGLHGDHGQAPVPGETMETIAALQEAAAASGWRIAASDAVVRALGERAAFGRRSLTGRGDAAIEVVGLGA